MTTMGPRLPLPAPSREDRRRGAGLPGSHSHEEAEPRQAPELWVTPWQPTLGCPCLTSYRHCTAK